MRHDIRSLLLSMIEVSADRARKTQMKVLGQVFVVL